MNYKNISSTLPLFFVHFFLTSCSFNSSSSRIESCFSPSSDFYYNPPTVVNGYIYTGSGNSLHKYATGDESFVYKLDSDLNKVWEYSVGTSIVRGSVVLDSSENIYFVLQTNVSPNDYSGSSFYLRSISPSGVFRWDVPIDGVGVNNVGMLAPAIGASDTIYVVSETAMAVNTSGASIYNVDPSGSGDLGAMNSPILDDSENLYFSAGSVVYSLNSAGATRWSYDPGTGANSYSSLAFNNERNAVFTAIGDTIYKINTADGTLAWSYRPTGVSGEFRATPAIDGTGNVYIGNKSDADSVLYAIKSDGSGLLWKQEQIQADLYSSPTISRDDVLYIGSERSDDLGGDFHAINLATGEVLWSVDIDAGTWGTTPFFLESQLYTSNRGKLCIIESDSVDLSGSAGSAKFRGQAANNGRYP